MRKGWILLLLFLFTLFLEGCTSISKPSIPNETPTPLLTTIADIERNPEAFRDRFIQIQGYGIITATMPLCPGYVGMDKRTRFVDATQKLIVAEVHEEALGNQRRYDPENLRVFEGYVRIFSGEVGCPGAIQTETFPYFEITGIK